MAELDKWQLREVAEYARNNGLTEAEALEALHPSAPPAEAEVPEAEGDGGSTPAPKVPPSKTGAK